MHILDQIRLEFNLITVPWYDLILYPKKERRKRSLSEDGGRNVFWSNDEK